MFSIIASHLPDFETSQTFSLLTPTLPIYSEHDDKNNITYMIDLFM